MVKPRLKFWTTLYWFVGTLWMIVIFPTLFTVDFENGSPSNYSLGFDRSRRFESLTDAALLVIASDRPHYLRRCLAALAEHITSNVSWPVIASEDGKDERVTLEIETFRRRVGSHPVLHIQCTAPCEDGNPNGYYRLARHYKRALNQVGTYLYCVNNAYVPA